jgi:hypothetical protein
MRVIWLIWSVRFKASAWTHRPAPGAGANSTSADKRVSFFGHVFPRYEHSGLCLGCQKDQRKQSIARNLIRRALVGEGVVSQQVLGELAAVLLHSMRPAAPGRILVMKQGIKFLDFGLANILCEHRRFQAVTTSALVS